MKHKKALLIDLDNTIYPAASIGDKLFTQLYSILASDSSLEGEMDAIKEAILRKPFHHVATTFNLSQPLYKKCIDHLVELTYSEQMSCYADFEMIRALEHKKFLITTGFTKLQQSKIDSLGIRNDFMEVHVMDFTKSDKTKKHAFEKIMSDHGFGNEDVLVIGDDPESEIKAGLELELDCILYDSLNLFEHRTDLKRITHFSELTQLLH